MRTGLIFLWQLTIEHVVVWEISMPFFQESFGEKESKSVLVETLTFINKNTPVMNTKYTYRSSFWVKRPSKIRSLCTLASQWMRASPRKFERGFDSCPNIYFCSIPFDFDALFWQDLLVLFCPHIPLFMTWKLWKNSKIEYFSVTLFSNSPLFSSDPGMLTVSRCPLITKVERGMSWIPLKLQNFFYKCKKFCVFYILEWYSDDENWIQG